MKLLLIDGHYYVYRSFFAIRQLNNSRGEPTNAIYGFIKTVRRMVKDLQPDLGAVIWDEGLPLRRTELQPAYKETRTEMPDEMKPQLTFIQKIVPLLGFASLGLPDTEADDLMASYTCAAQRSGHEVVLATNDKDLFQLVDERVKVYTTNKADFATPKDAFALLGEESVRKKWGVTPEQIGEVLSLIGDSVDNIPGVDGLGAKGAANLLTSHGSLDAILADLAIVKNDRLREKLRVAREQIVQNREMVRLDKDLPLPRPLEELRLQPRYAELIAELGCCEFKSLMDEIKAEAGAVASLPKPAQQQPPPMAASQGELF
jgi:DNA polymerase-1